jgi:TRAP-type C4-dicarboxylate transport system substrate-binding protein
MKRLLSLALLLAAFLSIGAIPVGFWTTAAAGAPNITVDFWQTFETDIVDAAHLLAADTGGTWSVSVAPTTSTSGSKHMVSTVNSVTDSGTRGLVCDIHNSDTIAVATATGATTASFGFWFKANPATNTFSDMAWSGHSGGYANLKIRNDNTSGTYTLKLVGSTTSSTVTVDATSWWWVTVQSVSGGTSSMKVYDASGTVVNAVAVTCTGDGTGGDVQYLSVGSETTSTSGAGTCYIDNLVINTTAGTFPLGP